MKHRSFLDPSGESRILFVDDEPAVRRLFKSELQSLGFAVDIAGSVTEAREKLGNADYEIVATDVHLPDHNGFDLARDLETSDRSERVILVTGDHEVDLPDGLAVEALIHKPWSSEDWTEVLAKSSQSLTEEQVLSVLLIEDCEPDGVFLEQLLDKSELTVETTTVDRLADALDLTANDSYDLIITDLSLPDARGIDTVRRLLRRDPSQPLIVISGSRSDELARGAIRLGADDYFVKDDLSVAGLEKAVGLATERRHWTRELFELAKRDALTGLSGRHFFQSRLEHALTRAARTHHGVGVVYVDLDGFKEINDTYGHAAGDAVLCEIAERLLTVVRKPDSVGRLGGDEFAIVLERVANRDYGETICERILHELARPVALEGATVQISGSVGLALSPEDGQTSRKLLRRADRAMYRAKAAGGNEVRLAERKTEVIIPDSPIEGLAGAIDRNEFELVYQPAWDVRGERFTVAEGLLRWRGPLDEEIGPDRFVPQLEASGEIHRVGSWVVDSACRQAAQWQRQGANARVAVNLSVHQFDDAGLVDGIVDTLRSHGLSASDLEIEITESVMIREPERAQAQLQRLRDLGSSIAIDDFGTGYSSLSYLHRLPIDVLKIDRSFVSELDRSPAARKLVESIIGLGHRLNLEVVAEGVETEAQQGFLVSHGCDRLQGYLLSKPLSAHDISLQLGSAGLEQADTESASATAARR